MKLEQIKVKIYDDCGKPIFTAKGNKKKVQESLQDIFRNKM